MNGLGRTHLSSAAPPVGLRKTLEDAGGMFVKLGQVASTRGDLLPPVWCEELARLRSHAAPAPQDQIRSELEEDLPGTVDDIFSSFDWTPIASASIAQVYGAELRDGARVVVKVQRPGLDAVVDVDAAAVMQLATLIERRTPIGAVIQPRSLAAEFVRSVREELDFGIEAANALELGAALADTEGVRVPKVYAELSSRRVLVEERVAGRSVADAAAIDALGVDRHALAGRLLDAFITQLFEVGVFHSDPHPGNVLIEQDRTIVLIDLGAVGRMGVNQRSAVLQMVVAAAAGDAPALRGALSQIAPIDDATNGRDLEFAFDDLLSRTMRGGGGITTASLQELVVVAGRFGIHMPEWFGNLCRTLITLEGTLRSIEPRFSLVDAAKGRLHGEVTSLPSFRTLRERLEEQVALQLPRLQRLPQRVDELLAQAVDGQFTARIAMFAQPENERVLRSLVNRVSNAVVCAALGIGSVVLLGVGTGPELSSTVSLNEVLGYIGLASASILLMRIVAESVRDG